MALFALTNQKGGSGKTTTAVNLAAALADRGRRVLLVDLDPQASATRWLGISADNRLLLDMLTHELPLDDAIRPSAAAGVDVVPSSSWLVGIDKALAGEVGAETILRSQLTPIAAGYDYCFIDCPPALGILTVNALAAAEGVLVPVEAHVMALAGLAELVRTVEVVRERLNPGLAISGIIACRVNRTRHAREVLEQLHQHFAGLVLETCIRENIRLAEAPSFSLPITAYDPQSIGAADFRALAHEIIGREK